MFRSKTCFDRFSCHLQLIDLLRVGRIIIISRKNANCDNKMTQSDRVVLDLHGVIVDSKRIVHFVYK